MTLAAIPPPSLPGKIRRFAALNMAHDAVAGFPGGLSALAAAYDMVSVNSTQVSQADLATLRQANGELVILCYGNCVFDHDPNLIPASLLKNAAGQPMQSAGWHNWVHDPLDAAWRADRLMNTRLALAHGFDGVMLDMCGPAPTLGHYLEGGPAIDPRTGVAYTTADWVRDCGDLAQYVRASAGGILVPNGLENGRLWPETQGLLAHVDGALAESWLKPPDDGAPMAIAEWLANVTMLAAAPPTSAVCAMRKAWGGPPANQPTEQEHAFSLASFLLGAGPFSFYEWSTAPNGPGGGTEPARVTVALGAPLGPMAAGAGVFGRQFTAGLVLVNPADTPATVALPAEPADPGDPARPWWDWTAWSADHPLRFIDLETGVPWATQATIPPRTGVMARAVYA